MNAHALACDYCGCSRGEGRKREPVPPVSHVRGVKRCRQCGHEKSLWSFSRDRLRPDGHWHTCKMCAKTDWAERGKPRAAERKLEQAIQKPHRTGLAGLRQSPRGRGMDALPPDLRRKAEEILSRSLARARAEGRRLNQNQIALRIGCAISNARRVGDRSWSRRMLRLKGYRRAERRKMEQEAQLAQFRQRRAASGPPVIAWSLRP